MQKVFITWWLVMSSLLKRKRECVICNSKVKLYDNIYLPNWRRYKIWYKCEKCGFLQSFITPDILKWIKNGSGGVGGEYELGYRQYKLARILADDFGLKRILIYGAGFNNAQELLLKDGYDIYSCDLVNEVIEGEKVRLGEDRYFHINNYPEEKFDGIVSVEVFEHLVDPINEIGEILSHLKSDGVLCFSTDFIPDNCPLHYRGTYAKAMGHVSYWSLKALEVLADRCNAIIYAKRLLMPRPSDDDSESMRYNKEYDYPNRYAVFIFKDIKYKDLIQNNVEKSIDIPTHHTEYGRYIDYGSKIEEFKDLHKNEKCFIVGNGPSLNKIDLNLLKDEITFGSNNIFKHKTFYPKYYAVEDWGCIKTNYEIINKWDKSEYKFIPKYHSSSYINSKNTVYIDFRRSQHGSDLIDKFVDKENNTFYWMSNVTTLLIQLAHYMGCNPIYLIGCDHFKESTDKPIEHFSDDYVDEVFNPTDVDVMNHGYQLIKDELDKKGVKVINLTPDSYLDVYPKQKYEDVV